MSHGTPLRTLRQLRITRANIVAQAAVRPGLRELLTVEQNRITSGIADVIAAGKGLGWLKPDLDARVTATFVQAYSLGRIVDDIADPGVDNDKWIKMIQSVVSTWLAK